MTNMTPKQYLSKALAADKAINRKLDRLADLYAACTKSTSLLTLTPEGGGHADRIYENRMVKYLTLRDEITKDIDRLVDLKTEIMQVIDSVPYEDCRCILEKHFLQGKSYTVIGQKMGYTGHYVSEKCRKALKKVQVPEKTS